MKRSNSTLDLEESPEKKQKRLTETSENQEILFHTLQSTIVEHVENQQKYEEETDNDISVVEDQYFTTENRDTEDNFEDCSTKEEQKQAEEFAAHSFKQFANENFLSFPHFVPVVKEVKPVNDMRVCSTGSCKNLVPIDGWKMCDICRQRARNNNVKTPQKSSKNEEENEISKPCSRSRCPNLVHEDKYKQCTTCREKVKKTIENSKMKKNQEMAERKVRLCTFPSCKNEVTDKYKQCSKCREKARLRQQKIKFGKIGQTPVAVIK